MKVVVLGAGALGSVIAGHLARGGEDVVVIARGERAGYLHQHGITITAEAPHASRSMACSLISSALLATSMAAL